MKDLKGKDEHTAMHPTPTLALRSFAALRMTDCGGVCEPPWATAPTVVGMSAMLETRVQVHVSMRI